MTNTSLDHQPDTREMVVIRGIFGQGFALLADVARQVPAGDAARRRPSPSTSRS